MSAVPAAAFRDAMGRLASGVTVVTARDEAGAWWGMTASAVCSLSLAPPMVLACIDQAAAMHDLLVRSEAFGVSVLAADQRALAVRFADRARHRILVDEALDGPLGLPRLRGALVQLACRRDAVHPGGDHSIVTGLVESAQTAAGAPLLYYRGQYQHGAR
jgi:flavin reductase (DIM6/NTAB) family NADH-FMN oxidoreductase RutF